MLTTPVGSRKRPNNDRERNAKPYCQCWNKRDPVTWKHLSVCCSCGEEDVSEWKWQRPDDEGPSWVVFNDDQKQVTFHPFYSSGTAAVRGDTPLLHNYHYYWEVKMLTETYGTDIMVGVGSDKVNMTEAQFKFTSLLGADAESYGLSYTGAVRHAGTAARAEPGFCRGSVVGVRLDMWRGTLEFYLNRKPQGISFEGLRRHQRLYPMVSSTAAQSALRLTYAASWQASLLVDAARGLAASTCLPPGLRRRLQDQFWLTPPAEGRVIDDDENDNQDETSVSVDNLQMTTNVLSEVFPNQYMNGFYVDGVERDFRVVVYE